MTPLTGADGQASRAASAPPQTRAGHRQRSLAGVLADRDLSSPAAKPHPGGMTIRPLSWALRPCQCAAAGHMMRQQPRSAARSPERRAASVVTFNVAEMGDDGHEI